MSPVGLMLLRKMSKIWVTNKVVVICALSNSCNSMNLYFTKPNSELKKSCLTIGIRGLIKGISKGVAVFEENWLVYFWETEVQYWQRRWFKRFYWNFHLISLSVELFVPTPLVGGGTIYPNGFFLFRQFWWIDIFILKNVSGIIKTLVQR